MTVSNNSSAHLNVTMKACCISGCWEGLITNEGYTKAKPRDERFKSKTLAL